MQNKRLIIMIILFFAIGISGILRFSGNFRTVEVLGLFTSGLACGVILMGFIVLMRGKSKEE